MGSGLLLVAFLGLQPPPGQPPPSIPRLEASITRVSMSETLIDQPAATPIWQRRLHCSKKKGLLVGALLGAIGGAATAALVYKPNYVMSNEQMLLWGTVIGAGAGAIAGYGACSGG